MILVTGAEGMMASHLADVYREDELFNDFVDLAREIQDLMAQGRPDQTAKEVNGTTEEESMRKLIWQYEQLYAWQAKEFPAAVQGYGRRLPKSATVVQIDLDYRTVGKNRDIDLGLVGDPGAILAAVTQAASGRLQKTDRKAWFAELRAEEDAEYQKRLPLAG